MSNLPNFAPEQYQFRNVAICRVLFSRQPAEPKEQCICCLLEFPDHTSALKTTAFPQQESSIILWAMHTAHVTLGTKRLARHSIAALVPQAVVACLAGKVLQRVVGTLRDGTSGFVFIAAAAAAASASCCQTAAKGSNSRSSSRYAPEVFGFNAPFCTMREPKSVCSCENVSRKRAN